MQLGKQHDFDRALELFLELQMGNMDPTRVVVSAFLGACADNGKPRPARQLIEVSMVAEWEDDYLHSLQAESCSTGCVQPSTLMPFVPPWSAQEMVRVSVSPDLEMFTAALLAASTAKSALEAERLFAGTRARSVRLDQAAGHHLVNALRAGGQLKRATELTEQLRRQGIDVQTLRR